MWIDAHQHFWKFDPVRDSWITDEMQVLQSDFLPEHLEPFLQRHGFDGCVVVQSDSSEVENKFQLENANRHPFIKGVVGWVDLQAPDVEARLDYNQQFPKMKGFRHIVQAEPDDDFLLRPAFKRGISHLSKYGYTYDLLIYHRHLKYALQLVDSFPDQKFIIDHLSKPSIKTGEIESWKRDLKYFANHPNVYCKVSGMVTEGAWNAWKEQDFTPYLDVVTEVFGTDRLVYGSDWPVCLLAATYQQQLAIAQRYFETFSIGEQANIFGDNAVRFYNL